jgi:hypothetical protein
MASETKAHPPIIIADLEFTAHGRNLNHSKIFAMAFVLIHPEMPNHTPIPPEDKFVVYMQHEGIQNVDHPMWNEIKGKEFWLDPKQAEVRSFLLHKVATEGVTPQVGFARAWDWLVMQTKKHPDVVLGADGGGDFERVNWGLAHYCNLDTVQYLRGEYRPYFDMSSWCMGIAYKTWKGSWWGNERDCAKVLNVELPKWNVPHDHNPVNDAEKSARDYAFIIKTMVFGNNKA